ncbi:Extracellular matrix protein FRAS1 like protein [Argiope bruennichi]|uniref:Extracellular matrix protein FRAS1 like protein n=1 Tax=Argiope bruennichi TaxID=94029 RepID=A0A8T0EGD9_ARGBR|nr:Extracellular matrix protein FRAS1 like protein [Argiope bruennichi]
MFASWKPCFVGTFRYSHNEVWQSQLDCILNQCKDGIIVPYVIQCPSIVCSKKLNVHYKDPCTICVNEKNEQKCYSPKCPPCSSKSDSFLNDSCCYCFQECNESCARCLKDGTCQYCEDNFYLEEEFCVDECTPGYYKFLDAYCLLCHETCEICYGSNDTDCSSCKNPLFIKNGKCVPHCSNGFFQDNGVCYACDLKCKTCSSSSRCTSCDFPLLLRDGECVDDCGTGQYADYEVLICKRDLVLKVSDGYVSSSDIILPMQIVSKFPPQIGQLDYIVVSEESLFVINPSILAIEDKDNIADVTLNIVQRQFFKKTKNLIGLQEMKEEKISFTQADIDNGMIHYNHDLNGTLKIKVKVLQNHPAIISSDHLSTQVNGISPNDIVYMITRKLLKEEGFLENLDQPGIRLQSFTQNDIDTLKIVYHPPPYGGASEKQFMFQFVGKSFTLQRYHLAFTDLVSEDKDIVFSLLSMPKYGILEKEENGEYYLLKDSIIKKLQKSTINFKQSQTLSKQDSFSFQFKTLSPDTSGFNSFTQEDIDRQYLKYQHNINNPTGTHYFKFNIKDPANNTLIDQTFFITISEDIFPPIITRNSGLKVNEKGQGCINAEMLAAVDEHQKTLDLVFSIVLPPSLGYLEHKHKRIQPLNTFLMSDLKAGEVCYTHSSLTSNSLDSFTFNVSDGRNSDQDVIIKVLKPPQHGVLENANNSVIQVFSLNDIKHGHISYSHDGSESVNDNFTLIVSDGINKEYIFISNNQKNITSKNPIRLGVITKDMLLVEDLDTNDSNIVYAITLQPHLGFLQLSSKPGEKISHFNQKSTSSLLGDPHVAAVSLFDEEDGSKA